MRQQIMNFGKTNVHDFGFAEEMISAVLHPRHLLRNLLYGLIVEHLLD
jgi:hypothetical protein